MREEEGGWAGGPENAWRRRREHPAKWCRRFLGMIFQVRLEESSEMLIFVISLMLE